MDNGRWTECRLQHFESSHFTTKSLRFFSSFELRHSFVIGASTFVILHFTCRR